MVGCPGFPELSILIHPIAPFATGGTLRLTKAGTEVRIQQIQLEQVI